MIRQEKKRQRRQGFTLLELLVVLGVIGILLSLLLPQIREARRISKVTVCTSNYRQIGSTLFSYATDYDGNLFQIAAPNSGWVAGYQMMAASSLSSLYLPDLLGPYTGGQSGGEFGTVGTATRGNMTPGNFKNWTCPFVDALPLNAQNSQHLYLNTFPQQSMNVWLFFNNQPAPVVDWCVYKFNQTFPTKLSQAPSGLPLAQDLYSRNCVPATATVEWYINHSLDLNPVQVNSTSNPSLSPNLVPENAGFGATFLFYDGSARHVPRQELTRSDRNATTPDATWAMKSLLNY